MGVKLSHAKANELGGVTGGQPGDQMHGQSLSPATGPLEIATEDWYNKSDNPWLYVLRPPTTEFANRLADFAEAIVANDNVGYAQDRRNTLLEQLNNNNWDLSRVAPCDCDCSSMIRVCCIYAGRDPGDIYTASEYNALVAIGFTPYSSQEYVGSPDLLKRGDVLLRNGHTAVVTTGASVQTFFVWMRWDFYESGKPFDSPEGLSIMGGTGNGAYGQYGFHYRWGGLIAFMQFCVSHNANLYAPFNQYIALGNGNEELRNNTALHDLFIYYAYNYTQDFAWCQDTYVLQHYIQPVISLASQYNVANLDSPFIRGALSSFAIRNGVNGSVTVNAIQAMANSNDITTQLQAGYAVFDSYYSYEGDRFVRELADCLADMQTGANVYDLYTNEPYVPVPVPVARKGMPVWMMLRYF